MNDFTELVTSTYLDTLDHDLVHLVEGDDAGGEASTMHGSISIASTRDIGSAMRHTR